MQLPLTDPDTLCEDLVPDLPPETAHMAREFNACVRAKKVKTPEPLLRVLCFSGGLAKPWREVAGTLTVWSESITDQAVAERLRTCGPWVHAMRRRRLPLSSVDTLPAGLRLVVIDASSIQAPGATGTDPRLQSARERWSLPCVEVLVPEVHTGETRKHVTLRRGDVAVTDRGDAPCQGRSAAVKPGAYLIVRLNPFRVVLGDAAGEPLARCAALKRQQTDTIRTLALALRSAGGPHEGRGWVHADRLHAEQAHRARHTCRQRQNSGPPKAASLVLAGWVLVLTTLALTGLSAQTIMALDRCRWPVERAIKRWKRVLAVDALRAQANSPLAAVWLQGT